MQAVAVELSGYAGKFRCFFGGSLQCDFVCSLAPDATVQTRGDHLVRLQSSIGFQPVEDTRRMRIVQRTTAHFARNDITITCEPVRLDEDEQKEKHGSRKSRLRLLCARREDIWKSVWKQ